MNNRNAETFPVDPTDKSLNTICLKKFHLPPSICIIKIVFGFADRSGAAELR